MNSTLSKFLIFAAGAAAGSFVTYKLLKTKYEQLAQSEIDSVIEEFSKRNRNDNAEENHEAESEESDEEDVQEYVETIADLQYTGREDAERGNKNARRPYVIAPEDFGECDEYTPDQETLFYYNDGIMTDDQNNIIEDVDDVVGVDSVNHFGEYEEDAVHVRNEKYKTDYEILRVDQKYFGELTVDPHRAEGE